MVELITSHPKVNTIRNEDDDSTKQEIHIVDGQPVKEESVMGVMRVNTSKLIYQPRIDEFD